jgi:hypothetical protein
MEERKTKILLEVDSNSSSQSLCVFSSKVRGLFIWIKEALETLVILENRK